METETWEAGAPTTLVALEHGAKWPSWLQGGAPSALILSQQPSELALAFARRVVRRLSRLGAETRLERAVIAVAPDSNAHSFDARCVIVRAALCAIRDDDRGSVLLAAEEDIADEERHELVSLVGALAEHLQGRRVGLRFGDALGQLRRCGPLLEGLQPLGLSAAVGP